MSTPLDLHKLLGQLRDAPDVDQGPMIQKVMWVLTTLSIIVVGLRLLSKWRTTRRLYLDDALMTLSLLVGVAHAGIITQAVYYGFGRHIIYLSLDQIQKTMKLAVMSFLFGFLSPMLGRLAFCQTLLMITRSQRVATWPIWVFVGLQIAVNMTGIIIFYTQCGTHLNAFWDVSLQLQYKEYCSPARIQSEYGYFMGSINTVTDGFLAVMPAVLIEQTRLSRKTKIGLWLLLCMSVFAMGSAIIKTYEAQKLSRVTDYTYALTFYVLFMSVELNIVIITASIPFLRPLFKREPKTDSRCPSGLGEVQLVSVMSGGKDGTRVHTSRRTSSLDNIVSYDDTSGLDSAGITVTREVEVSYAEQDVNMLHAALVGLRQGEIANPRLARSL